MTQTHLSPDIEPVYQLLSNYSFDVDDHPMASIIHGWLNECGPVWVSHAITEALYQGRYKVVSIDHILKFWQRRGQPIRHFNREFESIILGQTLPWPGVYSDSGDGPPLPPTPASPVAPNPFTPPAALSSAPDSSPKSSGSTNGSPRSSSPDRSSPNSSVEQPIPDFRPLTPSLLWAQGEEIRPFVPRQDSSELHQRLQAVVKGGMRP